MRKFDYMEFSDYSYVFDAEKYTKEEALKIHNEETESFDATIDDVKEDYVAFRLGIDNYEFPDGAYWRGMKGRPGAFKVWVIE